MIDEENGQTRKTKGGKRYQKKQKGKKGKIAGIIVAIILILLVILLGVGTGMVAGKITASKKARPAAISCAFSG